MLLYCVLRWVFCAVFFLFKNFNSIVYGIQYRTFIMVLINTKCHNLDYFSCVEFIVKNLMEKFYSIENEIYVPSPFISHNKRFSALYDFDSVWWWENDLKKEFGTHSTVFVKFTLIFSWKIYTIKTIKIRRYYYIYFFNIF